MYEGIVHTKVQLLWRFNSGLIAIAGGKLDIPLSKRKMIPAFRQRSSQSSREVGKPLYGSVCSQGEKNPNGDLECFLQR